MVHICRGGFAHLKVINPDYRMINAIGITDDAAGQWPVGDGFIQIECSQ